MVQMAGTDIHIIKLLILEGNWLRIEERPQQEPRRQLIEAWADWQWLGRESNDNLRRCVKHKMDKLFKG